MNPNSQRPVRSNLKRASGIPRTPRPMNWTIHYCRSCFNPIGAYTRSAGKQSLLMAHKPYCVEAYVPEERMSSEWPLTP